MFGVAIGNVLQGLPFSFDTDLRIVYSGTFLQLFNPFALLCGLVSVTMLVMHGGFYLSSKTEGDIAKRSLGISRISGLILIVLFAIAGVWVSQKLMGYRLTSAMPHDGFSNPLFTLNIVRETAAWMNNYQQWPWLYAVPGTAFGGVLLALLFASLRRAKLAFTASALSVIAVIATVGVSMFPFILPSTWQPNASLLVWNASSSQTTLFIMLVVTIFFMPIILAYTAWVYRVMRGTVTEKNLSEHKGAAY